MKLIFGANHAKAASVKPAQNKDELSQDIALWFALDNLPFSTLEKHGFQGFMAKNMPQLELPSSALVRNSGLMKVYSSVKQQVASELSQVKTMCLMFDGWTDKHKARCYMGLRASVVSSWEMKVITISCKPLPDHKSESIAKHIRQELSQFVDLKSITLYSTHDGAENMKKSSERLQVEEYFHCAAHALNLLLVTDGISNVDELDGLISNCKTIVTKLHYQGHLINEELQRTHDQEAIENLLSKISKLHEEELTQKQFPSIIIEDVSTKALA
jgi:hypothetical protein